MRVAYAAATDVGRKRPENEDSYCADPTLGLYLVADGMGGHAAGEVASKTVAETVRHFIVETREDHDKTWPFPLDPTLSYAANRLRVAILVANRALVPLIEGDEQLRGMATTISAVLLDEDRAVISNVGDCRAYLIREGLIKQVTVDHSWVGEQIRAGLLTADAAKTHPWRSMVTRAISGVPDLDVDIVEFGLRPGDTLVLCSDGLHGLVSDEEMAAAVRPGDGDLEAACRQLISLANERGGPDNITAILIQAQA